METDFLEFHGDKKLKTNSNFSNDEVSLLENKNTVKRCGVM